MRRIAFLYLLTCTSVIGCTLPGGSTQPTGAPIIVGAPISLTGNQATSSRLVQEGYELWRDWVDARGGIKVKGVFHKVNLYYEDDKSQADQSVQATQKLISDDQAQFLLAPYGSILTEADAKVASDAHVPIVVGNGASKSIYSNGNSYVFGVQTPADKYLTGVLDMVATMSPKPTRIAILSANDSFSLEVAKATSDYAPSVGMSIVYSGVYPSGSLNLSDEIGRAKAANPDILIDSGHLDEAIAINKAAKVDQLNPKLFAYSVGPDQPQFLVALGRSEAGYVVTGSQWSPYVKYAAPYFMSASEYVAAFKQKFNTPEDPSYVSADATASGVALQKAIENADSLDREAVRQALASLDLQTMYGRIKFDSTGLNTYKPMVVQQIQDGTLRTIWPREVANAQLAYPTPGWSTRSPGTPSSSPTPKLPGTGAR